MLPQLNLASKSKIFLIGRTTMKPIRSPLLAWTPALLWAVALFVLSSLPPVLPPEDKPRLFILPTDKLAHIAAYALLSGLILFALRRAHNTRLPKAVLLAILLTSGYGATDEWHQSFVPDRYAGMDDWVADATGAALAGIAGYIYESRRSRKTNP
jgi:VanZ family protein